MTRAELRAELYRRLEESSSGQVFFDDDDLNDALNDGYMELSDATEWYEVYRTISILHTRTYYDLRNVFDVEVLSVGPAFHVDANRWLIPSSVRDLDGRFSRWEIVRGVPERVHTRGLWWVGYWPILGSETGTIKQYVSALPATLGDDTDEPGFDAEFHKGVIEYALAELLPQQGEVTAALEAWQRYLAVEVELGAVTQGRGMVPKPQGYGVLAQ